MCVCVCVNVSVCVGLKFDQGRLQTREVIEGHKTMILRSIMLVDRNHLTSASLGQVDTKKTKEIGIYRGNENPKMSLKFALKNTPS